MNEFDDKTFFGDDAEFDDINENLDFGSEDVTNPKKTDDLYEYDEDFDDTGDGSVARIKVVGVGGGGNNAINRMKLSGVDTAKLIAMNTDKQDLSMSKADINVQIGKELTHGLGAGANPEIGKKAALESKDLIVKVIKDTDLLFITAGMGGGTGTGAAPVIAKLAKDMGLLTVAVVTRPFAFEGKKRAINAQRGIVELKKYVDTIVVIPNEKLMEVVPKGARMIDAFKVADDTLRQGIKGISDLIIHPGLINLDFNDIKTIMKDKGMAHMGIGRGKGENRTMVAVKQAVRSPLLETSIEGATGIILNVKGNLEEMRLDEVTRASKLVEEAVDPSADIIFGTSLDNSLHDEVVVTVIATGFGAAPQPDLEGEIKKAKEDNLKNSILEKENQNATVETVPDPTPIEEPTIEPIEDDPTAPAFIRKLRRR